MSGSSGGKGATINRRRNGWTLVAALVATVAVAVPAWPAAASRAPGDVTPVSPSTTPSTAPPTSAVAGTTTTTVPGGSTTTTTLATKPVQPGSTPGSTVIPPAPLPSLPPLQTPDGVIDPAPLVADAAAQVRLNEATLNVLAASTRLAAAQLELMTTAQTTKAADDDVARATLVQQLASKRTRASYTVFELARRRLQATIVASYVTGQSAGASTGLDVGQAAIDHDTDALGRSTMIARVMQQQRSNLARAAAAVRSAQGFAGDLDQLVTQAQHRAQLAHLIQKAKQQAVDDAQKLVDAARKQVKDSGGAAGPDPTPTILGPSILTYEDLVGWFRSVGVHEVTAEPIEKVAFYYIAEGKAEGVRADLAFAQAFVETGGFASYLATKNNFAGIGACDSCATGFSFSDVEMGVRAQIQLLRAFADPKLTTAELAHPPAVGRPEDLGVRGCCPTWGALTHHWATDPSYGLVIMQVYARMTYFALARRQHQTG